VKRTAVIATYEEGGLKMLDVECFITAQKVMWVKRLMKDNKGGWRIYPQTLMDKSLGNHFFECNTNIAELARWMPKFDLQVFEAWERIKEAPEDDPFKLRREILWFNKMIKIRGREICYKHWNRKGIVMLHDILEKDGSFKGIAKMVEEYGEEIKTMEYNGLISAIPSNWKKAVKSMKIPRHAISNLEQPFVSCSKRLLALSIVDNRDVYWELVAKKRTMPISAGKWCNRYQIDMEDWKMVFKQFSIISDTRLKAFQFKILYNLTLCNLYLKRIGKSDTDKCPKCNELDDIIHYFVECTEIKIIWNQLSNWWNGLTNQNFTITARDIMLGLEKKRATKLVMHEQLAQIILAVKWTIYVNNQLGEKTCFYQILCSIQNMIEIQRLIAARKQKITNHNLIWGEIENYLT
jgi:hypothetical protein